jgi:phosphoserine phosphatase
MRIAAPTGTTAMTRPLSERRPSHPVWIVPTLVLLGALGLPERSEAREALWEGHGGLLVPLSKQKQLPGLQRAPQRRPSCQVGEQLALPMELSSFGGPNSALSRWMLRSIDPKTCKALNSLIASNRRGAATFDADGTLWKDDVGEGFFAWMLQNRYLPGDRRRIASLERTWRAYKAGRFDGEQMYELMVTSMAGMREQDVFRLARRYFDEIHKRSIYQPMAALVSTLSEPGFSPWVVSGSPYWVGAAGARHFGIPPSRVIGLKVRVDDNGRLTDEVLRPVPWKDGKAQRILSEIGDAPVIAAGNSHGDLQMLKIASDLPLAINPAPDLMRYARGWRWHVSNFTSADTLERWQSTRPTVAVPARPLAD